MAPGDYPIDEQVKELVDRWCDRRDLRSLRIILSDWPRASGLTDEPAQLMEALRSLRADRRLPDDEHEIVERFRRGGRENRLQALSTPALLVPV